ncbi:hypothetical protein ACHWI2_25570, partial [Klebsiella pneumoniae]
SPGAIALITLFRFENVVVFSASVDNTHNSPEVVSGLAKKQAGRDGYCIYRATFGNHHHWCL